MSSWHVLNAECVAMMQTMDADSIDAIVCDPPYDLIGQKTSRNGSISTGNMKTPAGRSGPSKARGFMGMHWDGTGVAFAVATWQAALRVAKPGGTVLDPFCGSGTTGCACVLEDFAFIGIEQDTEHGYIDIARARIAHYAAKPKQRSLL